MKLRVGGEIGKYGRLVGFTDMTSAKGYLKMARLVLGVEIVYSGAMTGKSVRFIASVVVCRACIIFDLSSYSRSSNVNDLLAD